MSAFADEIAGGHNGPRRGSRSNTHVLDGAAITLRHDDVVIVEQRRTKWKSQIANACIFLRAPRNARIRRPRPCSTCPVRPVVEEQRNGYLYRQPIVRHRLRDALERGVQIICMRLILGGIIVTRMRMPRAMIGRPDAVEHQQSANPSYRGQDLTARVGVRETSMMAIVHAATPRGSIPSACVAPRRVCALSGLAWLVLHAGTRPPSNSAPRLALRDDTNENLLRMPSKSLFARGLRGDRGGDELLPHTS